MGIEVKFVRERETTNTIRYAEVPRDPNIPKDLVVGPLYIHKIALRELGNPESIKVTIEPAR